MKKNLVLAFTFVRFYNFYLEFRLYVINDRLSRADQPTLQKTYGCYARGPHAIDDSLSSSWKPKS
jgi:hypothetical protein